MKVLKAILLCSTLLLFPNVVTHAQEIPTESTTEVITETTTESTTEATTETTEESKENIVTITLYSDENTVFKVVSGEGTQVVPEDMPEKENYKFLYWIHEENGEKKIVESGFAFDEDVDLYAYWDPQMILPPGSLPTDEQAEKMKEQKEQERVHKKTASYITNKKATVTAKLEKKNTIKITAKMPKMKYTEIKGYEIQYSTSKTFKNAKKVTVKSTKRTITKKIKVSKKKKSYYVRVRSYNTHNPATYGLSGKSKRNYSKWSKVSKIKIK